jgi:hypothetical protein
MRKEAAGGWVMDEGGIGVGQGAAVVAKSGQVPGGVESDSVTTEDLDLDLDLVRKLRACARVLAEKSICCGSRKALNRPILSRVCNPTLFPLSSRECLAQRTQR